MRSPFESARMIDGNVINDYNEIISRPQATFMASLTIRNLEEDIKHRLRVRAAERGRSMEEEARTILRTAIETNLTEVQVERLGNHIHAHFAELGGVELDLPERSSAPAPADFEQR